ncbi:MAG: electron transfer flavoprotein subunit alpha/FixB family protein [Sporolactobacillus sp.]
MGKIWVIADAAEAGYRLINKATQFGADVTAFINADPEQAALAFQYGAMRTVRLPFLEHELWENYALQLAQEAEKEKPELILVTATKRGKTLAAYLGGLIDTPVVTEIKTIARKVDAFELTRMVYGGLAEKKIEIADSPVIVTIAAEKNENKLTTASAPYGTVEQLNLQQNDSLIVKSREQKQKAAVNLAEAKTVVGVGRGFGKKENLQFAQDLAKALEGEIACSRPVTEDFHWLPEEQYVGISGQVIKPDLYMAIGISGQVQHVYGVRDAKLIVAINKDESAPIFNESDYYIVGDLQQVIPEIIQALHQ